MTNELSQHGSFNIGIQDIQGNVNVTQILGKSVEYKDLLSQLETQRELFAYVPEDQTEKRLRISQTIAQLEAQIEQFKQDVTKLAQEFNRIEINTDRLRRAKEHFEQGEIAAARAVFDSEREQMQDENNRLVREKERYEQDVLPKLKHSSDEFYMRALLERTAYDNPNWLEDTCDCFERSISAFATADKVFQYALFLQNHNRLDQAETHYQKCLKEFARDLDSSDQAATLNNLGVLHRAKNERDIAETEYREALERYRRLSQIDPENYLPDVALTLNNLADLHSDKNELVQAEDEYDEALTIRRELAQINPTVYLPSLADTLNNFASLHLRQPETEIVLAERKYVEALAIRQDLAQLNPATYLPSVAMTINNLAGLHSLQRDFVTAENEFAEALKIRRELASYNPAAYLPDVAMTLINLSIYHFQAVPNKDHSINFALEALTILLPLVEDVPYTQNYMQAAVNVLEGWGLNEEDIERLLAKARS